MVNVTHKLKKMKFYQVKRTKMISKLIISSNHRQIFRLLVLSKSTSKERAFMILNLKVALFIGASLTFLEVLYLRIA